MASVQPPLLVPYPPVTLLKLSGNTLLPSTVLPLINPPLMLLLSMKPRVTPNNLLECNKLSVKLLKFSVALTKTPDKLGVNNLLPHSPTWASSAKTGQGCLP
jgi:hypothetical protein